MAGYYKKTAYLDYLENGMKVRNVGFIRLEERDGTLRLEVRVKRAPEDASGLFELRADTGGLVGRVPLEKGTGGCCMFWRPDESLPAGVCRKDAGGVYLQLPGRRLIQAAWDMPLALVVEAEPEVSAAEPERLETMPAAEGTEERKWSAERPAEMESERLETTPAVEESADWRRAAEGSVIAEPKPLEITPAAAESADRKQSIEAPAAAEALPESGLPAPDREEPVCYGDKWMQLCHMYPTIHPFGDGREYLSIAPRDFVVLRQDFQKMVHNSFLLHGYYNYRHLILGKIPGRNGFDYYLGVPGNFYDREKMVAEMFGFEAFEGEGEQAKPGDFGYYMKKVEL